MTSRAKKILLLAAAAGLFTANGFLLTVLNRERAALGITRLEPLDNAPPMLALTTQVLGGFRGLIANALWMRATQLQDDGKYFEQVQLADWITKLEPHIVQVWTVQSWNMSFNISVKFSDYPDRWRWVQRAMELLRDEALRYNPDQPLIYGELAWLFQFKMGQNLDDGHLYYKAAWAGEMMNLFGGPQPNFDRLLNPQTPDERERANLLRVKYKMDAAKMRQVNERYGPLDWRLPEVHAIYWASVGLDKSRKDEDVRKLRTAIHQSMNLTFQRGLLVLGSNQPPRLMPNLAIVRKVNESFQERLTNSPPELTNGIANAWRSFLKDVPYQFFIHQGSRGGQGEQWLRYLREKFPAAVPPGTTLAEYSVARAMENVQIQAQAKIAQLLGGMIRQSYYALIDGEMDDAQEYQQRATDLWTAYDKRIRGDQRLSVGTLDEVNDFVLRNLLGPEGGLTPEEKAILRTRAPRAAAIPAETTPPKNP